MKLTAKYQLSLGTFQLDAEFAIPFQGLTAIFGPSGCGKSTLLRCIAGLEKPSYGYFQYVETVWQNSEQQFCLPTHQRNIGYVFQDALLFPHLSVKSNLFYGLKRKSQESQSVEVQAIISCLGLDDLLARSTHRLSGGEKQRVAMGRALLSGPDLLLMDEPLSALDARSKSDIIPYLENITRELAIPVLYVSHSADEVARLADYMLLMEEGKIIADGDVNTIFTRLDLSPAHLPQASAIIETRVEKHDPHFSLTELEFGNQRFQLPNIKLETGTSVKVIVHARDVSLSLTQPEHTSILNIFPATIIGIAEENQAQVLIQLELQGQKLLSRITKKSASVLEIAVGKKVFAQIKSIALV